MSLADLNTRKFEELVADGFEHLWDYSYLGTHPLIELQSVKQRVLGNAKPCHVDVGRVLNGVLQDAIESLKPIRFI